MVGRVFMKKQAIRFACVASRSLPPGAAACPAMAASSGLLSELTPTERSLVLKHRAIETLSGFVFPFQVRLRTAASLALLRLSSMCRRLLRST